MDNMLVIDIGDSFLKNAGMLGLLFLLRLSGAQEKTDYQVEEHALLVNRDWLTNTDLAALYLRAVEERFYPLTRLHGVLEEDAKKARRIWEKQHAVPETPLPEQDEKDLKKYYKNLTELLERPSYQSGLQILREVEIDFSPITSATLKSFKAEKDFEAKHTQYLYLLAFISQPTVKRMLVFKESIFSFINLFWEGISFLNRQNQNKNPLICYQKDFGKPLQDYLQGKPGGKKRCLECGTLVRSTRSMSYMIDTNDDPNRKKAAFWNCRPDAFVCPVCAFLYTLVPFGFVFLGGDAVFVNSNASLPQMDSLMRAYADKRDASQTVSVYRRLYRVFTEEKIQIVENRTQNLQVVVRTHNSAHYKMNILDARMLQFLHNEQVREKLAHLEKVYLRENDTFVQIYDVVFDNIIERRSQYERIRRVLRWSMSEDKPVNFAWDILTLQVLWEQSGRAFHDRPSTEEEAMDELRKLAKRAFASGRKLRDTLVKDGLSKNVTEEDILHQLRGTIYRLTNLAGSNNRDAYLNTIIRLYSGRNLQIPTVFQQCFQSDELFRAIGHSYILGLNYQKYTPKNDTDQEGQA